MQYFDAHAHIQFDPYDSDREDLIAKMQEREVGAIIVGVDLASSQAAIATAHKSDLFYAAVGLHPNYENEEFSFEKYAELAKDPKVVAIGECGLDYFRPESPEAVKEKQKERFRAHVALAVAVDKPLIVHARPSKGTMDAYQDLIAILKEEKAIQGDRLRGDIHFFVGGIEEARELVSLGFTVSYTAVITFTHDYDEVIRSIPLKSLLTETDAPYVAPASRRGTRNDPLAVEEVVSALARIRNEDEDVVRRAVLQNAVRLFGITLPA